MSVPRIIVRDLGRHGNKEELDRLYARFGIIRNIWLATNPPGFAYIFYKSPNDAIKAVSATNGNYVCGQRVRVEYSPTEDKKAFNSRIGQPANSRDSAPYSQSDRHSSYGGSSSRRLTPPAPPYPRQRSPVGYRGGGGSYHDAPPTHRHSSDHHAHQAPMRYPHGGGGRHESHHRGFTPPPTSHDYSRSAHSNQRGYTHGEYRGSGRSDNYTGRSDYSNGGSGRSRHEPYPPERGGRDRGNYYDGHYGNDRGRSDPAGHPRDGYVVDRYMSKPQQRSGGGGDDRMPRSSRYQVPPSAHPRHGDAYSSSSGRYSHERGSYHRSQSPPANKLRDNDLRYRSQRSQRQQQDGGGYSSLSSEERYSRHRQTHSQSDRHTPRSRQQQHQSESKPTAPPANRRSRNEQRRPPPRQRRSQTDSCSQEEEKPRSRSPFSSQYSNKELDSNEYIFYETELPPREDPPPKENQEVPFVEEEEYNEKRRSPSHTPPPDYMKVPEGESISYAGSLNEQFSEPKYSNEGSFEYQHEELEPFPSENQYLQVDEVKDEDLQHDEFPKSDVEEMAAFYTEREVTYSPLAEREVVRISNEREVRLSRSPSVRESRSRSGTPTLMD